MYVNMLSAMAVGYVIETFKYSLDVRLAGVCVCMCEWADIEGEIEIEIE